MLDVEALLWLRILGSTSSVRLAFAIYGDHTVSRATSADVREPRLRESIERTVRQLGTLVRDGLVDHSEAANRRYWSANANGLALADRVLALIVAGQAARPPLAPEVPTFRRWPTRPNRMTICGPARPWEERGGAG